MNGQSIINPSSIWLSVERLAQNAVVQVFSQVGKFNWIEPYKVEEQFENRGTGFFINENGYIITNAHVVADAKTVWIQMPYLGRNIIRAFVVGFCPESDIALLKIADEGLDEIKKKLGRVPFLALGDSDRVARTEGVMVLGYPLGHHKLKSTIGIVSGRESLGGISLLQITAPINPGNSGGPLMASDGGVVGIAVAVNFMAQNVGYAIPINELKMIFDALLKKPLVRKPFLGAMFHISNDQQAEFLGNPTPAGFYIQKVLKDTPADKAGILPGDMLYIFNGFTIDAYGEAKVPWSTDRILLRDLIARLPIGGRISAVVYRNGEKKELNFELDPPPVYPIRRIFPGHENVDYEVVGGMVIMQLVDNHIPLLASYNPNLLQFQKVENRVEPALVITHILPGSYAHQLRCLPTAEIIRKVNGVEVKTLDEFRNALKKSVDTNYLTIQTAENVLAVFDFATMLKSEMRLSVDFVYPISEAVKQLLEMMEKRK